MKIRAFSPLFLLPFPFSRRLGSLLARCIVFPALQIRHSLIPIFLLCTAPHRTSSHFLGLLRPSPELGFLDIPRGSDTPIWSIDARFYPFMEATAAARGASLTMHSPQLSRQEWRAVADNHSARDAADEEMERAKLTQSDERTIYEVQQGREPLHVDFCSISIDGNPDNDILQRRLNDVARQREDLQQMEIELRAQVIARSEILEMQKSFDGQMKEHSNAAIKMQEQLCERDQAIRELERKIEDKDRELQSIKLDNEAAWAKDDLLREQDKEIATYRRERDHSEAERAQQIKQLHELQEHIHEKERQLLELQKQAMVARGDLGAELPIEEVPLLQEEIINLCRGMGKAVIVATNMLESMIVHPTPTRAEVSDIAIAVREGADAIMLSGETAHGKFPLKAVKVMHTVALRTEATIEGGRMPFNLGQTFKNHMSEMFAYHATMMSNTLGTSIVVFTRTGFMAILLSHYRPSGTTFAFTNDKRIQQRLALYQGVCPIYMQFSEDAEQTFTDALTMLQSQGMVKEGEEVALLQSGRQPIWRFPSTHNIQVRKV